ncbi:MAG: pyruvate, water dikinase regulatory protein [Acidobacteriota bacterium]|nr:pyruvate, water dikinase regulatory protein [Acidobacteriota bacterium]
MSQTNRYFFIVSDGSGETAVNLLRALLTQFSEEYAIFTRRYPKIKDVYQVNKVLNGAMQVDGPVFVSYTLVNKELRRYMNEQLVERGLRGLDLFSTPLQVLSDFLGSEPEENPDKFHGVNEQYFKRMEAIEFTLKHDDGKRLLGLDEADIVLVGVSRAGKTPLSMYLSLYGYKVVNIPLAKGVKPPPELDEINQRKVVALTIDPMRLAEVRKRRMTGLAINQSDYCDPNAIFEEIEEVDAYFRRHRRWPVIDVTNRSIEETAGLVRDKVFGRDRRIN